MRIKSVEANFSVIWEVMKGPAAQKSLMSTDGPHQVLEVLSEA